MSRALLTVTLAVALTAAACSGGQPQDAGGQAGAERSFGLVAVTYTHTSGEPLDRLRLRSTAQFVRYSGMDARRVARLLALPLDPERDLPRVDTCRTDDLSLNLAREGSEEGQEAGSVELLGAGDLDLRTPTGPRVLQPRHFPGLLPFVTGVVYDEARGKPVARLGRVAVRSRGGDAIAGFSVATTAPALPTITSVGGVPPGDGELRLSGRSALAVRWRATRKPARVDITYLQIRYRRGAGEVALRCRMADDGAFTVPGPQVRDLAAAAPGRVTVELARVRRAFFATAGLQQAELRVAVRDRATYTVR